MTQYHGSKAFAMIAGSLRVIYESMLFPGPWWIFTKGFFYS